MTQRRKGKLCICGRSASYPQCDNSHQDEDWSCVPDTPRAQLAICASHDYHNIALKLASQFNGIVPQPNENVSVTYLVGIVKSSDIEGPKGTFQQVQSTHRFLLSVDQMSGLLAQHFPKSTLLDLPTTEFQHLFGQLKEWVEQICQGRSPTSPTHQSIKLHDAFLSHAVKDEALLMPVIRYLRRHFEADLFLCADSISPTEQWQPCIETALRNKARFVAFVSKDLLESHFCSFEMGMACALQKPILMISLDGSPPPAFAQHIHMISLPRRQQQKPWLEREDLLLEAMLEILQG